MLTLSFLLFPRRMEHTSSPTQRHDPPVLQQSQELLWIIAAALYPDVPEPELRIVKADEEGYADAINLLLEQKRFRKKIDPFWNRTTQTFSNASDLVELVMDQLGE